MEDNLLTVSELSSLRWLLKDKCNTEQGIRSQLKAVESGDKTPSEVGFEVVRPVASVTLVRLVDPKTEDFRQRLAAWVEANRPV